MNGDVHRAAFEERFVRVFGGQFIQHRIVQLFDGRLPFAVEAT
jgi:hypothetical protein